MDFVFRRLRCSYLELPIQTSKVLTSGAPLFPGRETEGVKRHGIACSSVSLFFRGLILFVFLSTAYISAFTFEISHNRTRPIYYLPACRGGVRHVSDSVLESLAVLLTRHRTRRIREKCTRFGRSRGDVHRTIDEGLLFF